MSPWAVAPSTHVTISVEAFHCMPNISHIAEVALLGGTASLLYDSQEDCGVSLTLKGLES